MLKKELAKALGISPAMVRKLELRGMPTHDAALAKIWREANLDYTRLPSGLMKLHDRRAARAALLKSTDPRVEEVQRPTPRDDATRDTEIIEALAHYIGHHACVPIDVGFDALKSLVAFGSELLKEGRFASIEPALRAALRAIPHDRREEVQMSVDVWDALVRDTIKRAEDAYQARDDDGDDYQVTDDDCRCFVYSIAAGELKWQDLA